MNNNQMKSVDILDVDLNCVFLHYTNEKNLPSIFKEGLKPKIGENSKGVEKTKKVFFTIGDKSALIIMDVWLKWLISRPKNKYIYRLGAYLMTKKYFPKFIYNIIFNVYYNSEKKFYTACDDLKKILDDSVYLVLDLEENVDFDYNDIDEVKEQNFPRKFLKNIYQYNSDVNNNKMEFWNMHTYTNKLIEIEKISILKYNNNYKAQNIIKYLIDNNFEFVKENCKLLLKYYNYIYKDII